MGLIIVVVAYVIIVWRVLSVEGRERRLSEAVCTLLERVGHLEDELALLRNARLAALRDG
jgi:hypothetical protein